MARDVARSVALDGDVALAPLKQQTHQGPNAGNEDPPPPFKRIFDFDADRHGASTGLGHNAIAQATHGGHRNLDHVAPLQEFSLDTADAGG